MTVFERIKKLCQDQGITLQTLAEKTDMSINSLYKWKTSKPSIDKLEVVADYFHVSTDYLLGRTDDPKIAKESKVTDADLDDVLDGVMSFRGGQLTDKDREAVRAFLEGRLSK